METMAVSRIQRAIKLSGAIERMAGRMVDTDRAIATGIYTATAPDFMDTPEYRRLSSRRSYQRRAHDRLVYALYRMATE